MALAGISSPSGQARPSANQAAAPSAAPARIDVAEPADDARRRAGARSRGQARGTDSTTSVDGRDGTVRRPRTGDEDRLAAVADGEGRRHEPVEQRVRPLGPRLELRVELAGHEPRVVLELDDLDEPAVGRLAGQHHAGRLERLAVAVVHLEAVAMPLVDDLLAVDRGGLRAGRQLGRIEAEAHRAALVLHLALVGHEVDDGVLGEHVELGRVGVGGARRRRGRTR